MEKVSLKGKFCILSLISVTSCLKIAPKVLNIKHFSFDKCPLLFLVVFCKITMLYFMPLINSKIMCYSFRKIWTAWHILFFSQKKSIKFISFLQFDVFCTHKMKLFILKFSGAITIGEKWLIDYILFFYLIRISQLTKGPFFGW